MKLKIFNLLIFSLFCFCSCSPKKTDTEQRDHIQTEIDQEQKIIKLRHLVLFKFKETVTASEIVHVEKAFADLPSKIKEIKDFEWGLNISPENLNRGFTHGFLLTFSSEKDLNIYLPHPDHKAFGAIVDPKLEDVLVIDYWTN